MVKKFAGALCFAAAACGPQVEEVVEKVETSGKAEVAIAQVPREVLAAANAARPGFTAQEAERETREGRQYYDIEGKLPDGSEIEFDIMEEQGRWAVVETQRDIAFTTAPRLVREAVTSKDAGFSPGRVIESTQHDGIVIYELFGPQGADPLGRKVEVKWDGQRAKILTREWAH
jgi:hypothetical protein